MTALAEAAAHASTLSDMLVGHLAESVDRDVEKWRAMCRPEWSAPDPK